MSDNEIMLQALTEYEEKYWASNDYKWQEKVNALISEFRKKCIEERKDKTMSSIKDLPDEVILTADDSDYRLTDEFCESVNEYLADKYGFCNGGWAVEIKVSNIDWDTSDEENNNYKGY